MDSLNRFVTSAEYQALLNRIALATGIQVLETVSARMLELDAARLANAGLSVSDLESVTGKEPDQVIKFVVLKMQKYRIAPLLPASSTSHANSGEIGETLATSPFLPNFLVIYLVEYIILRHNPERLESYLRLSRIPNAKRYGRELHMLFDAASGL